MTQWKWKKNESRIIFFEILVFVCIPQHAREGTQIHPLNIHISSDNRSFTFYVNLSFLCHCQDFCQFRLYIWITWRVFYKKEERLTLPEHLSSPGFFCCTIMCCDVRTDFCIKTMFGLSLSVIVCRRAHVLFTLFVFVCI